MPKLLKKIIFSLLLVVFLFTSFTPVIKAQDIGPWYDQNFKQWYTKVYADENPTEIFGERYSAAQVQWVVYGLFALLINSTGDREVMTCLMTQEVTGCLDDVLDLLDELTSRPSDKAIAAGQSTNLIQAVFSDRPISGIAEIKNLGQKLNLVPEAKAQQPGIGFQALEPVRETWRFMRNFAYSFFVIAILATAFMIMFRVKISPQVVITIQSALPKIVLALILVTFSYAIAGFLIDLMYVVYGILSLGFTDSPSDAVVVFDGLTTGFFDAGIFGTYFAWGGTLMAAFGAIILYPASGLGIGARAGLFFLALIFFVVLAIIILFAMFKLAWQIIKTLAIILLLTIFAPLQIVIGIFVPSFGFSSWIKNFISNLAVFPAISILFYLAMLFAVTAANLAAGNVGDAATLGSIRGWPPMVGGGGPGYAAIVYIGASVAFGLLAPKVSDIIKAMIQGKPFDYGTAIGEAFGPVVGPGKSIAAGTVGKAGQELAGWGPVSSIPWLKGTVEKTSEALQKQILSSR